MIIFDSVCITPQFIWIEDRKYVQKDGILYTIRNREEDPDYTANEEWDLKKWKGKRCRKTRDQDLFTESVQEMKRILHTCESSRAIALQTDINCANSVLEDTYTIIQPTKRRNLFLSYLLQGGGSLLKNSILLKLLYNM